MEWRGGEGRAGDGGGGHGRAEEKGDGGEEGGEMEVLKEQLNTLRMGGASKCSGNWQRLLSAADSFREWSRLPHFWQHSSIARGSRWRGRGGKGRRGGRGGRGGERRGQGGEVGGETV